MIQMHAVMSEWERDQISIRTKAALAADKARGVKLGTAGKANLKQNIEERKNTADAFVAKLAGVIHGFKSSGLSQRAMVTQLNQLGIRTAKGRESSLIQLQRVIARITCPTEIAIIKQPMPDENRLNQKPESETKCDHARN